MVFAIFLAASLAGSKVAPQVVEVPLEATVIIQTLPSNSSAAQHWLESGYPLVFRAGEETPYVVVLASPKQHIEVKREKYSGDFNIKPMKFAPLMLMAVFAGNSGNFDWGRKGGANPEVGEVYVPGVCRLVLGGGPTPFDIYYRNESVPLATVLFPPNVPRQTPRIITNGSKEAKKIFQDLKKQREKEDAAQGK